MDIFFYIFIVYFLFTFNDNSFIIKTKEGSKNMRPLTYEEFKTFLNSYIDEATYFNYSKKDLISLKEYLIKLQKSKIEYERSISEYLKQIQEKNKWVTEIKAISGLVICGKSEPNIEVKYNIETGKYIYDGSFTRGIGDLIKLPFRKEIINNSQKELIEIGKIAESIFSGFENTTSITGIFKIENLHDISILKFQNQPLFVIERETGKTIDHSYEPIPEIQRNKLLKKIMIKPTK